MKKLIITAVAMATSIIVNAASVSWCADVIYNSNGSGNVGSDYIVYFLTDTDYAYTSALTDISAGKFGFLANAKEGDNGVSVLSEFDGYAENYAVDGYVEPLTTSSYLVIFDASTVDAAKNVYITSAEENQAVEINAFGGSDMINFGEIKGSADAGNWTAVAPEPTSGLLLLLGMAGLALRRKQK